LPQFLEPIADVGTLPHLLKFTDFHGTGTNIQADKTFGFASEKTHRMPHLENLDNGKITAGMD
jgi:hypothetical protein